MNTDDRYKGEFPPEVLKQLKAAGAVVVDHDQEKAHELLAAAIRRDQPVIRRDSKYQPHQGAKERARRLKRIAA